jgi:hypothetical protein
LTAVVLGLSLVAFALVLTAEIGAGQQISTDTVYRDENLVFIEDVEVTGGAKLTLRGCDVTFRPPGTTPLYLRVTDGTLDIIDTDIVGEGSGFIVSSHGNSVLRNVTANGLGAVANSSLSARGLPLAAHGGFMFYSSKVDVYNLDIGGAPATALYSEDCDITVFSLGSRDASGAYTAVDQGAAVAIVYLGTPWTGSANRTAELNSSKIQTSGNHGVLVAAASTGYSPTVTIVGTEISTSAGSGLLVYEVNAHGDFVVQGDGNEIHHSDGHGLVWVRSATSDMSTLHLEDTRIHTNKGNAFHVVAAASTGGADLTLEGCSIEDTVGTGTYISSTTSTQSLNVTLKDSTIKASGGHGVYFVTSGDGKTSQYHVRLIGTSVLDSGSYGIYTHLSQCYATFNLTLRNSHVIGSSADGIHMVYSLTYFSYTEAPIVTSNLTVVDSTITDNSGYGVYDSRYLRSYYYWAQAKSTHYAMINILGTTIANHTKSAVLVTPTTQFQYCTYTSEGYIEDSTFTNNSGYGFYEKVDSLTMTNGGSTRVQWHVRDSTFTDLANTGFYIDLRRADGATLIYTIRGSTFRDLGDHGVVLTSSSTPYGGKLMAVVSGCTFTDLGDNAIYMRPGRPGTTGDDQQVTLQDIRAHNTTGIYVSLDGYAAEDYYELHMRGLNVTRTRGDAIGVYLHPYQSARAVTELRDIYTRNTNGTALTLSYTSDRRWDLWGELSGNNVTLLDQVAGLIINEHTGILENLTIRDSVDFDMHKVDIRMPLDETGILELHSVIMDRKKVKVVGTGSLWVFNELRVRVEWQNGMAALGAGVQIQDRAFKVVAVGHVDSEAGMDPVELLAYILDAEEFRSRSPFIVNITFLDLEQTGVCSLDEPATVLIVVFDRVAPSMVILEPDHGAAQRASYFELRGSAFDAHSGILDIRYRIDEGNWTSVGPSSPFRTTVEDVEPGQHMLDVEVIDRAGNIAREVVSIEIDNQPPRLVVVSPDGDIITRNPVLTVRGETEEGATVSINGDDVETLHGLFIADVDLQEGANTVTVVSMDRLSNVATVRFIAVLDTVEPFLDVDSHADGDWVDRSDQTVTGIVEEGCTLTVQGVPVEVDNLTFETLVQFEPGDNLLIVRAVDPAGNVYTETLSIHVATNPPWLNLEAPLEGSIHDQKEVRVLATVPQGSVVTVNGRRVTIQKGLVDELLILPEGMSTITIEAIDPAGNVQTVTRRVTVDTVAPVLTLEPLPAQTREVEIEVSGTAEGAVSLLLDGVEVALAADGAFSTNVSLAEGTNVLRLTALDAAGHADGATATVVLDTTPPFIRLLLPDLRDDGNGTLWSREQAISVQVVSEPGASITLNDVYIIVGDDGTAIVDLYLAGNGDVLDVFVLAVDDLGNSQETSYRIAYKKPSEDGGSIDWNAMLPVLLNLILLVAIVFVIFRYRKVVQLAQRRRRRPRPPGTGHRINGNGNGHTDGDLNGNGGGLP